MFSFQPKKIEMLFIWQKKIKDSENVRQHLYKVLKTIALEIVIIYDSYFLFMITCCQIIFVSYYSSKHFVCSSTFWALCYQLVDLYIFTFNFQILSYVMSF